MATTPKIRRSYKGAPVQAALNGTGVASATTTTLTLSTSPTSWPTGKFFVVVAPGTAQEEKMCVTLSGATLTVVDPFVSSTAASTNGRGVDNTTARSLISGGAVVYPVATAVDFDEANSLASTYANQGGIVYLGDPSFTQLAIGTAGHALKVNSGATAPEWGQLAAAGLATDAVETAKIKNLAVTEDKLAPSSVTSAKIADDTIVNADINSAAGIVDTKLATISTADKVSISALNIDGATDINDALVDADLIIVDDGAGGTNRKSALSRVATYLFGKVSGDVTATSAGAVTIGAGKVTSGMIADGTIVTADINASAGIEFSKLASAAWSTYTVTWTAATTNPAIGNGTVTGYWQQIGKIVHGRIKMTAGSTTTFGTGAWYFSLPTTARSVYAENDPIGGAMLVDAAASAYVGTTTIKDTGKLMVYSPVNVVGTIFAYQVDGTNVFNYANQDSIHINFTYEAA